ncbi:tetratricopeptide repeat protein [Bordetella bronchiseptica]
MKRSHRLGLALAAAAPLLLLGGCQTSNVDTAMQLMQQQQQEQALAQQREDADERKRLAAKPELALSLIREAQREGRYFASLAYLDAYRQNFGDSPQVAVMRADALRMTGQIAQSESAYRALTGTDQAAAAWHGLGLLAGGRGDFDQAADYLARATRLRPTDANMLNDLGYALLRAGDPRGARLPLGQAAELAPANAKVLGNLALLLLVEGDYAGARQVMDRAALSPQASQRVQELASQARHAGVSAAAAVPVAQAAGREAMVMPVLQRPVMDRFGNPPLLN